MIAGQAVQVVRKRLAAAGERASWTTLRNIRGGKQRVTVTATAVEPGPEGDLRRARRRSNPGGTRKTVV